MKLLAKVLGSKISPVVYLLMGMSVLIGFFFCTGIIVANSESVLYNTGVLVGREVWGIVLLCTSLIAIYGFATNNDSLISMGGIGGFMAWLFASIALALASHWYVLITIGLLHLTFHIFVVVATATNHLRRRPIR